MTTKFIQISLVLTRELEEEIEKVMCDTRNFSKSAVIRDLIAKGIEADKEEKQSCKKN